MEIHPIPNHATLPDIPSALIADHTGFLDLGGTRAMTGALDIGTNDIANAGTISGATIIATGNVTVNAGFGASTGLILKGTGTGPPGNWFGGLIEWRYKGAGVDTLAGYTQVEAVSNRIMFRPDIQTDVADESNAWISLIDGSARFGVTKCILGGDATPGATTALTAINNATTGDFCTLAIISGTSGRSFLSFGDSGDDNAGNIEYNNDAGTMSFRTVGDGLSIIIDSSGFLTVLGRNEGDPSKFFMSADQHDDAGDSWLYQVADGGVLTLGNDIDVKSTYVPHVTITPNATVADSTFGLPGFLVLPKASTQGIKVDLAAPTFGFADIIGDQFSKNTGATKPVLSTYNGAVQAWKFEVTDEAYITYHIPHDYVAGSPIFMHIHWSHTATTVIGGTVTFKLTSILSKSHNQQPFQSSPSIGTFTGTASTVQYQQILSEVLYSDGTPTGLEVDVANLEPDSVIELTFEVDANDITVSGGGVPDIFVHYVDIHYQTTGLIGTKAKAPDFYV